ncbi:hypothetical protein Cs7R123_54140 [Catellatospora sp. TT07R-123]|uniref:hypothetical protein n=1 Tax=Catellatospora sp. TT07R-123 TaxID=2733863 RepID=UPI001B128FCB|nr:hypothetical protein [Catellatospora sp. TT07R-123]GHJ48072.1 hypothetical protein Cs7R123_54140 [Catellatospora sp. TT07R-123]
MPQSHRRPVAIPLALATTLFALGVLGVADTGVLGGAVVNHGRHVYLLLFSEYPEWMLFLVLVLLTAAAAVGIRTHWVRVTVSIIAALALLASLSLCMMFAAARGMTGESGATTVAKSDDFALVRYNRAKFIYSDDLVFRLRSRDGLLSYESGYELACFISPSSGADPEWLFQDASLTGPDTVRVVAQDGAVWDVRFDPGTLRPVNPVDRCTGAPDPVGSD